MTTIILSIVLFAALAFAALMFLKTRKLQGDNRQLRAVVDNQENYTFLIDNTFEVKETNVKIADGQPRLLGNVLHCKNSQDTGHCGEGEGCRQCPVRFVINKSFERHDDFRELEACMELAGDQNQSVDIDVNVDGSFINIDSKPHMVVNVKNVTTLEGNARPKILFVSENTALYNKVREALGITYRVLNADSEHHALHRLLRAADYHFCAVMTDNRFYRTNNAVTAILTERKNKMPVFVFAKPDERPVDEGIHYVNEDFSAEQLLQEMVPVIH